MARDYAYEALAKVTDTDWVAGRGELNAALKSIREQEPELEDSYLLGAEIHDRAKAYRLTMGEGILLTPSSLAKHWHRVVEQKPVPTQQYNPPPAPSSFECQTCHGDKLVLMALRTSKNPASSFEEYAVCPDCNADAAVGYYRYDGSRFRPPSPEAVRARMQPDV